MKPGGRKKIAIVSEEDTTEAYDLGLPTESRVVALSDIAPVEESAPIPIVPELIAYQVTASCSVYYNGQALELRAGKIFTDTALGQFLMARNMPVKEIRGDDYDLLRCMQCGFQFRFGQTLAAYTFLNNLYGKSPDKPGYQIQSGGKPIYLGNGQAITPAPGQVFHDYGTIFQLQERKVPLIKTDKKEFDVFYCPQCGLEHQVGEIAVAQNWRDVRLAPTKKAS